MKVLNNSYLYRDIYKIPYRLQNLRTAQLYYVSPCHIGSTQFDLTICTVLCTAMKHLSYLLLFYYSIQEYTDGSYVI